MESGQSQFAALKLRSLALVTPSRTQSATPNSTYGSSTAKLFIPRRTSRIKGIRSRDCDRTSRPQTLAGLSPTALICTPKEVLHHSVVETVSLSGHALLYAILFQCILILNMLIMPSLICSHRDRWRTRHWQMCCRRVQKARGSGRNHRQARRTGSFCWRPHEQVCY